MRYSEEIVQAKSKRARLALTIVSRNACGAAEAPEEHAAWKVKGIQQFPGQKVELSPYRPHPFHVGCTKMRY